MKWGKSSTPSFAHSPGTTLCTPLYICLQVLIKHGNELHLLWAKAFPYNLTICVTHLTQQQYEQFLNV